MNATRLKLPTVALASFIAAVLLLAGCRGQSEQAPADGKPARSISNEASTSAAKCPAHGAPKELCFICDASLRDKDRLWCSEHGRYEDRCWECHPELQDKSRLWCAEHSLYEDECFLCHPELLEGKPAPAQGATSTNRNAEPDAAVLMCSEHNVPERECGICHPELLGGRPPGRGMQLRLPSAASAAHAGVVVGSPGVEQVNHGVECFAELTFDQNKLAHIASPVDGVVKSVEVDLGARVAQGALLARLASGGLDEAQSEYLKALAERRLRGQTLERERDLRAQRISSERDLQEAEAAHDAALAAELQAIQELTALGLGERQIQALVDRQATLLEVRAPFAGEIVERTAVQGALVEAGKSLFTLANTAELWAMLSIPETGLLGVRVGQNVQLTVESLPGETFTGTLTWLAANVDERTRMAQGRVEVANADRRLKAQMFARAFIVTSTSDGAVVVPQSALQSVGGTPVVFVKSGEDLFEARPVRLGAKHDGRVEIVEGLRPADSVVVAGSFALKSQFLISRLGAGCVD